jgi:hypothetical protein
MKRGRCFARVGEPGAYVHLHLVRLVMKRGIRSLHPVNLYIVARTAGGGSVQSCRNGKRSAFAPEQVTLTVEPLRHRIAPTCPPLSDSAI